MYCTLDSDGEGGGPDYRTHVNPICVGTLLVFHNDKLAQVQSGWWVRSCLGEVVFQGGGPADRTPV